MEITMSSEFTIADLLYVDYPNIERTIVRRMLMSAISEIPDSAIDELLATTKRKSTPNYMPYGTIFNMSFTISDAERALTKQKVDRMLNSSLHPSHYDIPCSLVKLTDYYFQKI